MIKKTCLNCKKEFKADEKIRIYCGNDCRISCPIYRKKLSDSKKGKKPQNYSTLHTPENLKKRVMTLKKNRILTNWKHPMSGKKHRPESIKKMSQSHKGCIRSYEHRKKLGKAHTGIKSHFWKGGLTRKNYPERVAIMSSLEYKIWRKSVFEKDDYRCMACGQRGGELQVDHILPFSKHPRLRFDINNGQTLCVKCHKIKTISELREDKKLIYLL